MAGEGWVHLDVKPRNVVMTSSPRLIDLSVARRVGAARRISRPVGTDAYMAPEQCDPARFTEIGPAADVWGLGATLFEALTGRQAYPSDHDGRFPQLRVGPPSLPDKAPPALDDRDPALRRQDDDGFVLEVVDDDRGDGDDTAGDDGTSDGNNTGDGDRTAGDDGTSGGNNTAEAKCQMIPVTWGAAFCDPLPRLRAQTQLGMLGVDATERLLYRE